MMLNKLMRGTQGPYQMSISKLKEQLIHVYFFFFLKKDDLYVINVFHWFIILSIRYIWLEIVQVYGEKVVA